MTLEYDPSILTNPWPSTRLAIDTFKRCVSSPVGRETGSVSTFGALPIFCVCDHPRTVGKNTLVQSTDVLMTEGRRA